MSLNRHNAGASVRMRRGRVLLILLIVIGGFAGLASAWWGWHAYTAFRTADAVAAMVGCAIWPFAWLTIIRRLHRWCHTLCMKIEEYERTETGLRESAERHRELFENACDMMFTTNLAQNLTSVNRAYQRITGYTHDELIGMNLIDLIAPEYLAYSRKMQAQQDGNDGWRTYEVAMLTQGGGRVPVDMSTRWIYEDGKPIGTQGIARDITERLKAQAALQKTHEEALGQAKEALDMMIHAIRPPMNGVIGMAKLLCDSALSADQQDYAAAIRQWGENVLAIIDSTPHVCGDPMEASQLELDIIDFELRAMVEDVLERLTEQAHGKRLELAGLVHAGVPTWVAGDLGRLRQLLTNLVHNAVKFTNTGDIVVQVMLAEASAHDALLRFAITDTGIDISPKEQARLCQLFSQADPSTMRNYGGAGLELAFSKRLVALMDGEIGVESTPGQGSTFWFTARLTPRPAPGPVTPLPTLRGLRLLCTDDTPSHRTLLEAQLSTWDRQVDCIKDAQEALAHLQATRHAAHSYDLVMLEDQMPGTDGSVAARTLKADPSLAAVQLILPTSRKRRGQRTPSRCVSFASYLTKPIRPSQLYDCIATVMGLPTETESRAQSRIKVLLVEDNIVNQKVTVCLLAKLGCEVETVANGCEAVEAVTHNTYDLVLMDCVMPEMDGYEATVAIRAREAATGGHVPIIAMTADARRDQGRERCLEAGMDDVVHKPVVSAELEAVLQTWTPRSNPLFRSRFRCPSCSRLSPSA